MKHPPIMLVVLLLLLLLILAVLICVNPNVRLKIALSDFAGTIEDDIPEDIHLTIYYLPPYILLRIPTHDPDALIRISDTKKITVSYAELSQHWETLKKLNPAMLKPVSGEPTIDIRIYYVLEAGDRKLLEVCAGFYGDAIVNGIEVENDPIFCELIVPFLSAKDRSILELE